MQRLIQSYLGILVVVFLLVSSAAAFNEGLVANPVAMHMGKRRMTNAERFALNLPPNPPAVRHTPGILRARDQASATTTSSSSPSSAPTPPVTCTASGFIGCSYQGSDGYVNVGGPNGALMTFTNNPTDAANVTFDMCATVAVNIQCLNCPDADRWPYIAIVGAGDYAEYENVPGPPGSDVLGYIAPAQQTPPGSTPQNITNSEQPDFDEFPRPLESAVWLFDHTTNAFTLEWVNDNGSTITPAVTLVLGGGNNYFLAMSSVNTAVSFYYVPQ